MAADLGGITPLQLLQDEFTSSEQEIRLNAVKRVKLVGDVLGPEQTRSQLIPFLNTIVEDDDEILLALAEQLGQFVPTVGGSAHANLLLPCLENLAAVEETVVRDKAVESLCTVIRAVDGAVEEISALVKRLSTGDWFTARVSACGLYAAAYEHTRDQEQRGQLRAQFELLANDDTPMVRRSAASKLGGLAAALEAEYLLSELLPIFKALANDDQDSVRLLAVEQVSKVASVLMTGERTDDCVQHVLPIAKHAVEDRSWRVRYAIAKDFSNVCKAMGPTVTANELLASLTSLLQDQETEVRSSSVKNLGVYVDLVGADQFVGQVMPYVHNLMQDANLAVRVALSEACTLVAPKLGEHHTVEAIMPMLQAFLKDDSPEVRLHILNKLDGLSQWLTSMAEHLLPTVLELGQDNIWRVRKAVIANVPMLTERMGVKYFEDNLLEMYMQAYSDSVNEVRVGASGGLQRLCRVCGGDWVAEKLLPQLKNIYQGATFYLIRITVMNALKNLVKEPATSSAGLTNDILELILKGAHDKIPNVRFSAVKALQDMAPHLDAATLQSRIRPTLRDLAQSDPDEDVKYFAGVAVETLGP